MGSLKGVGISAFALKMFMVLLMVGDHLAYFLPWYFPFEFRYAGRLVAPTFAYLMTVSLLHTRNRSGYILRLVFAGAIMLVGNTALIRLLGGPGIFNNIFLSLAIGAALIDRIERIREGTGNLFLNLLIIILLLPASLHVEGLFLIPAFALAFYFLRGNKLLMCLGYILFGGAVVIFFGLMPHQHLQVLALVPILLYNGRKGGERAGPFASKWFFYIFYPLHVWALYLIRHYMFFV